MHRVFGCVLLGLTVLPGLANAAGKCERLVATGNPEYPPYLWRDPQNPKQLIGANADLTKLRYQARKEGIEPLRIAGARKVMAGVTTLEEVLRVVPLN